MTNLRILYAVLTFFALPVIAAETWAESPLPAFGQNTVLVWERKSQDYTSSFVARIAEFSPDRYLEWEDSGGQGTILMPSRDVLDAKGYYTADLFESGMDTRGKDATTLWLSRRIFRELKEKGKAKCSLDGVAGVLTYLGEDQIEVEVNRSSMSLPVIKVSDGRGGERWFLNQEENPLLLKHAVRHYTEILTSITTDRPNTLRWIKGKKLATPPK